MERTRLYHYIFLSRAEENTSIQLLQQLSQRFITGSKHTKQQSFAINFGNRQMQQLLFSNLHSSMSRPFHCHRAVNFEIPSTVFPQIRGNTVSNLPWSNRYLTPWPQNLTHVAIFCSFSLVLSFFRAFNQDDDLGPVHILLYRGSYGSTDCDALCQVPVTKTNSREVFERNLQNSSSSPTLCKTMIELFAPPSSHQTNFTIIFWLDTDSTVPPHLWLHSYWS